MRKFKLLQRVAVGSLIAVLLVMFTAPSASAYTLSKTYTKTKLWVGTQSCVRVTLTGTMRVDVVWGNAAGYGTVAYHENPRLISPSMRITVYNNPDCTGTRLTLTEAQLRQMWHYNSCSANPGVSASYPWGVSVSVTPTCGKKTVAKRTTFYHANDSTYNQYTSGTVARWKKSVVAREGICLRATADVTQYRRSASYSKTFDMGAVCT